MGTYFTGITKLQTIEVKMRYCIWNNKGGVGKSFLTYCLSVEYAIEHPDRTVAVVDMCPQANVSEVLLGGNGRGEENLARCYENGRTIASYIKSRYDRSRFGKLGDEIAYFVQVSCYNKEMPDNLYLLPGDTDLDICASIIDYLAVAPESKPWQKSRHFLADLLDVFEHDKTDKPTIFIDSNPSFSNYTQLGMVAANRLIVPCTADSASIRGIYNILRLVFGVKTGQIISEDEIFDTFTIKMREAGLTVPKIHSFVLNKSRTIDRGASSAYISHVEEISKIVSIISQEHPKCFVSSGGKEVPIFNMKDCNTIAPVLHYKGVPPSKLANSRYKVYDRQTQVNQSQIDPFLANLTEIVSGVQG
jgi:cellulose biosynthesis protein BcsQ